MDRYVVIHVATTCDEHGVYVTKDSAEVIEIGWILLNAKTLEEVGAFHTESMMDRNTVFSSSSSSSLTPVLFPYGQSRGLEMLMVLYDYSFTGKAFSYGPSIHPSLRYAVCRLQSLSFPPP